MNSNDPVPPAIRRLLTLFEEDLADASFPDVDASILGELEREVQDAQRKVDARQEELDHARATLDDARQQLRARAKRALAYARVFAEDDEPLREKLDAIALEPKTAKKRKTRRKKKAAPAAAEKPDDTQLALARDPAA